MTIGSNRMRVLLIVLGTVAVIGWSMPASPKEPDDMITLNPQTLKFIPIPNMPACATAAILRGNRRWGGAWVRLRMASGCNVPWHWRTGNGPLLVGSAPGTVVAKEGPPLQFALGAFAYLPRHHQHQASCARTCLLF